MSHHVSASPTNPTGAVEVVRVSSSATTTAPVDGGGATGAVAAPAATPVSTVAAPGQSGTPGATLPVADLEQASNTIQGAQADLSVTAGAERRLDGFDGVGGGGGGGGENAGTENADNATGAVAQGTADQNVSDQDGGLGAQRVTGEQAVTTTADTDPRSTVV
jgi:hypothetical protein